MTDRDEATGQFASDEPLYGQAGLEHDAGYVPLQDGPPDETPEELTEREAAEKLTAQSSTPEGDIRTYTGITDLDENVSMTIDQAAKVVTDSRAADEAEAEDAEDTNLRKEVDALRGVDPKAERPSDAATNPDGAPQVKDGDLEPELERALSHPKVREAITSQIAESENARQTYSQAADVAMNFSRASFEQSFPEIAGLPLDQWVPALTAMSQREPGRFQAAMATLNRVASLQNAHQFEHQRQEAIKQQEFQRYGKNEDARLDAMLQGESEQTQRAVIEEIFAGAKAAGLGQAELLKLFNSNSLMRSADFQKMMYDAAKYRLLQKAPKAVPIPKALPPVQRPGTTGARSARDTGGITGLSAKFNANPSMENAAALRAAKVRARG